VSGAAGAHDVAPAVPATLACIESSFAVLALACTTLEPVTDTVAREPFENLVYGARRVEKACATLGQVAASVGPAR
jgi:hypothetical protein